MVLDPWGASDPGDAGADPDVLRPRLVQPSGKLESPLRLFGQKLYVVRRVPGRVDDLSLEEVERDDLREDVSEVADEDLPRTEPQSRLFRPGHFPGVVHTAEGFGHRSGGEPDVGEDRIVQCR